MEDGVKDELLAYASSALAFSQAGASPLLVTWNHVVLLHGPAGTGKTSLATALAHKLAVRHGARFSSAQLVEINAHALFSRWFSESGKLVSRLFSRIGELAEDGAACRYLARQGWWQGVAAGECTASGTGAAGRRQASGYVRRACAVLLQRVQSGVALLLSELIDRLPPRRS